MRLPPSPGPAWAAFTEPDAASSTVPSEDEPHPEHPTRDLELMRKRKPSTHGSVVHKKPPKIPRLSQGGTQTNMNDLADVDGTPRVWPPKSKTSKVGTQNAEAGPSRPRASRVDVNPKPISTQPRRDSGRSDISNAHSSTFSTQPIAIPEALSRPSLAQAVSAAKTRVKRKKNNTTNLGHPGSSPELPESISADLRTKKKKFQKEKASDETRKADNRPVVEPEGKRSPYHSTKGSKSDIKVPSSSMNTKNKDISRRKTFPLIAAHVDEVINLLSSDDEPPAATRPSKNSVRNPLKEPVLVPGETIDLTLDTDDETLITSVRCSISGLKSATSTHKFVLSTPGSQRLPTTASSRVRDDGVISLSDDEELPQPPIIPNSPVVPRPHHSTPSVFSPSGDVRGDITSNQDTLLDDIPSEISNAAGEVDLERDSDCGPDIDVEPYVDMEHPEMEVEPNEPHGVTTSADTFTSFVLPTSPTGDNDKHMELHDFPVVHHETVVSQAPLGAAALIENSQAVSSSGFPSAPSTTIAGKEVTPNSQSDAAPPGAINLAVAGHDSEPAPDIGMHPVLPNFDVVPDAPSLDSYRLATADSDINMVGNNRSLSQPPNSIQSSVETQADELSPKHTPLHLETITPPPRPAPVVVNGPFIYTDRLFALMDKRVQRQSIVQESTTLRDPTHSSMVEDLPSGGANVEKINSEQEVETPSDALHEVVIKSPLPSKPLQPLQQLQTGQQTVMEQAGVETMSQSQPSSSFPQRPSTRRSSFSGPTGRSLQDVINEVREQYEEKKTQGNMAARSDRSRSLTKEVVDLTLSDDDNDDGLRQDAISSSDHFMCLFDLVVPSLKEGDPPAKVSRRNTPLTTQDAAWVVRSDSDSRDSSVSILKKLPTLDDIRSIRKRGKKTSDDRTKSLSSLMPGVPRKPILESSVSPVAAFPPSVSQAGESPVVAQTWSSNAPLDKLRVSTPPPPPSLIPPATRFSTMDLGMAERGGLAPPIALGHQSTESLQKILDQDEPSPVAVVTDGQAPDANPSMDVDVNHAISNSQSPTDLSFRSSRNTQYSSSLPTGKSLGPPAIDVPQPRPPTDGEPSPQKAILCPLHLDNESMDVDGTALVDPPLTPQPVPSDDSDDPEWSVNLIYPDDTEILADNPESLVDDPIISSCPTVAESEVLNEGHFLPYGRARELLSNSSSGQTSRSPPNAMDILDKGTPVDILIINEPQSNETSNGFALDAHETSFNSFPIITWVDIRAAARKAKPKYLLAKDLPHDLQDYINAMDASYRAMSMSRTIFEANIIENTMDDEPDAPPIRFVNEIDDEPTPLWEFHYTNQMWHGEGVPPPNIIDLLSCDCEGGGCDPRSKTCACLKRQQKHTSECTPDFAYDQRGRLKHDEIPIFECNDLCGCGEECRNRVVQHGRKWAVNIAKTREKGWGVFAGSRRIPNGSFIGIYAGELLTEPIGEERGMNYNKFGRTYLFDIDFHVLKQDNPDWKNMYVVDAYHAGNFTRYLNHSCDPNCSLNACYINEANIDKPLLAIFTRRDVEPGEELCFSYSGLPHDDSDDEGDDKNDGKNETPKDLDDAAIFVPCRCGTTRCTGVMFK